VTAAGNDFVVVPYSFVAVKITVYTPAAVYVWDGCCSVAVWPSPNCQSHAVGSFVDSS
jgi:hypothetical protein